MAFFDILSTDKSGRFPIPAASGSCFIAPWLLRACAIRLPEGAPPRPAGRVPPCIVLRQREMMMAVL
jgi:hypothetical protein